jgi:hypothetical protein
VDVHDGRVASTDDVLVFEDGELSLKVSNGMDGLGRAGQDETGTDVFVVDTAKANADVVTTETDGNFFLKLVVDRSDFDDRFVGHEKKLVVLFEVARFDFADDDGAHVFVLF